MKSIAIAVVAFIALVVALFTFYPKQVKQTPVAKSPSVNTTNSDAVETREDSPYIEYSPGVLERTADKKRVLFFYANWCPVCKPLDQDLTKNPNVIPQGVVIIRVNFNDTSTDKDEEALAAKYGVTYQHTFVQIDKNGDAVTIWNGGGLNETLSKIK